jgi:hypothetical protein
MYSTSYILIYVVKNEYVRHFNLYCAHVQKAVNNMLLQ